MFKWFSRRAEVAALHQRIDQLERALASAGSSARPDMVAAMGDSMAKQMEASGKLLATVTEVAAATAARALGRRRASAAERTADGRFKPGPRNGRGADGEVRNAYDPNCKVCRGRIDITPPEVDRHYALGHPTNPVGPTNGGPT